MVHCAFSLAAAAILSAQGMRQKSLDDCTCNTLINEGSFCTVDVEIGTPPQKMRIVADTGSDRLVVESCVCVDSGSCKSDSKCFRGHGHSDTFHLDEKPVQETITYGSGPIDTVAASDQVSVGGIKVEMQNSLMLMSRNRLRDGLQLSGILGLGLPHGSASKTQRGFMDQAHVPRFSMCFNGDGKDGVLRMGNSIAMDNGLPSVGQMHWGVDFRGITVSDASSKSKPMLLDEEDAVSFCSAASMTSGQETPCGAIVDSGTTLILAPKEHLTKLFSQICDAWPKCRANPMFLSFEGLEAEEMLHMAKAKSLLDEAAACDLHSMPNLNFHVGHKDGSNDVLTLSPNDYMIETSKDLGIGKFIGFGHKQKVCKPAFEAHEYHTVKNGPVWILGTPFFYKFNIAYDRSTSPPAVSFNRAACGSCAGASLASFQAQRRHLDTQPRTSFFNASLGL